MMTVLRKAIAAIPVMIGLLDPIAAQESCRVAEQTIDGKRQVVIENRFLRLTFEPDAGGMITGFRSKVAQAELIRPKIGLLADRFWQVSRRQNPWRGAYQFEFQERAPERIVLRLWRDADGEWNYHSIEKTVSLSADSPLVRVDYAYKVHENRMTPSIISPWGVTGMSVAGEQNRIFLPLTNGVWALDYNPTGPPFHQRFFYNPARGWMAVVGRESGTGIAATMDLSRVMAFYLWFGNNVNTMEWMYSSCSVRHGDALRMSHEFIPFRGLTRIAGAGGGVVTQLDVPETVAPGKHAQIGVKVYDALPGAVRVRISCEKLPGRLAKTQETRTLDIPVDDTRGFTFTWHPEAGGTYAVHGEVFRGSQKVCDFELPAHVGQTDHTYALPLLVKRLGDPGERFGAKGAALKAEDIPALEFREDIVTPHIKWAKPYHRGPRRVFFLTDQIDGREIIELKQRMQIEAITPLAICNKRPFTGDLYGKYTEEMERLDLTNRLKKRNFDVIVVGGGCRIWAEEHRKMVADLVKEGVGLVWISAPTPDALKGVLPIRTQRRLVNRQKWNDPVDPDHPVTRLLPLSMLPHTNVAIGEAEADAEVLVTAGKGRQVRPLIAVADKAGRGRVVQLNYGSSWLSIGGHFSGITPFDQFDAREPYPYWEYWYSLVARAILWAGRFDAPLQPAVERIQCEPRPGELARCEIEIGLEGKSTDLPDLSVELTLRSPYADVLYKGTQPWRGKAVSFDCGELGGEGRHFADIRVLAQDKVVSWGTHGFVLSGGTAIRDVQLDRPSDEDVYVDGERIEASAKLDQLTGECQVIAELRDGHGRLLSTQTVAAAPSVQFSLPVTRPLHPGGLFAVRVVRDGTALDEHRRFVTVLPASYASQEWDDFVGIVWGVIGSYQKLWLAREKAKQMHALGFNAHNCIPRWAPLDVVWPLRLGFRPLAMSVFNTGHGKKNDAEVRKAYQKTGDKSVLMRRPSLSDPAFQEEAKRKCREVAEQMVRYRPLAYNFGDEVSYAPNGLDYDFSPHALADMRNWLRTQYSSLAALNKEWEADFKTWADVVPFTSQEAVKTGHYARWADLRLFACHSVATFHHLIVSAMKEADPNARYGLSGTQVPYPYNGMDWAQVQPVFSYHSNYWGGGELPHLHADIAPNCRLAQWTGYGGTGGPVRLNVWRRFLCNQSGISFYEQFSMLNPDLRPSQSARDISAATLDLRRGLAKLLMNSTWTKDRVAIYYSMPSILGATITGRGGHKEHRYGWLWALKDCGIQPKYITYLDVRRNGISRRDFDVVVLPMVIAMSPEEANAIRSFVADGGAVLADSVPAVLSGHCRKLASPPLDDVFGVRHVEAHQPDVPVGELKVSGQALGLALGTWSEGTKLATSCVRLAGGKALGSLGDSPAFIVNRFGKGRTCYLNIPMTKYQQFRADGRESELRERVRSILAWADTRAVVQVATRDGQPINKLEVHRYVAGASVFVGYVLDSEESVPARTTFPRTGHVYDLRAGRYLGEGRTFDITLPAQDAQMLAVLPYRVNGLSLAIGAAKAGQIVEISINVKAATTPGLHCFRLEVVSPAGKLIEWLAQNVIGKAGQATAAIPFAVNDPVGTYSVHVRDVATGLRAETGVRLHSE